MTTLFQISVPGPPGEPESDLNTAGAVEPALPPELPAVPVISGPALPSDLIAGRAVAGVEFWADSESPRGWVGCDWTFGGFCIPTVSHHLSCWIRSSSATLFGSILLSSWFAAHGSGLDSTGSASSRLPRWSCSASCSPRFVWQASDFPWLQQAHHGLGVQPASRWFLRQRFSNISRQANPRWFTGGG